MRRIIFLSKRNESKGLNRLRFSRALRGLGMTTRPAGRRILVLGVIAAALLLPGSCRKWDNPLDPKNRTNNPPGIPSNPRPDSGAAKQDTSLILTWTAVDPDSGDVLVFDVYFGAQAQPPLAQARLDTNAYNPGNLSLSTVYRWKVVVRDSSGDTAAGPVWSFTTTAAANRSPYEPSSPRPGNGATRQDTSLVLSWSGGDPDSGDVATYDIYFGIMADPPLVWAGLDTTAYNPGSLNLLTEYFWKVIARDNHGDSAVGPVWNFTTIAESDTNHPPYVPSDPLPDSAATGRSRHTVLGWTGGDPDSGDVVSYDVYFGTSVSPPLVVENHPVNNFEPGILGYDVEYFWRIVARDNHSAIAEGPVWRFHTVTRVNVTAPAGGSRWQIGSAQVIEWTGGTDPKGGQCRFARPAPVIRGSGRTDARKALPVSRSRSGFHKPVHLDVDSTVIYYSTDNGGAWIRHGKATVPGRYDWTVPGPETREALVQVQAYVEAETVVGTSGQFEIYNLPSPITVTMPTDSTRWRRASAQTILWTGGTDKVDSTMIYFSTDNGGAWIRHGEATFPGRYDWTVPGPETREALVQVQVYVEAETVVGTSGQFEIYNLPSPITVTMPTDSTRWRQASAQTILWTGGTDRVDSTMIYFSTDNGGTWICHGKATSPGRYDWSVPGPATPNAKVQVWACVADTSEQGTSPAFEIYDSLPPSPITVTSPTGSARWEVGTTHQVTWTGGTFGVDSTIVHYSTDAGSHWERQGKAFIPGVFVWEVPGPTTNQARIQVRAHCIGSMTPGTSEVFEVTSRYPDTVVATVTVGEGPRGLCWNRTNDKVYVANYTGGSVTVINGTTNQVDTTVTVGSYPSSMVYDPTDNKVYVANEGSHSVSVIDGASNTVVATVEVGVAPRSLAWNRTGNKVYVANYGSGANSISVIDAAADTVVATVGVGVRPIAVCWNPVANKVYAACWTDNEVTIIDGVSDTVITAVPVGADPCFIVVDSVNNEVYIANQSGNTLSVIDGASNMTLIVIDVSLAPCGLCWNPVSAKVYSADKNDDNVSVISTVTHRWIANVGVGQEPRSVIWMPAGNAVYVANHASDDVAVIGGESNQVELTLDTGAAPIALCFNIIDRKVYVANYDDGTVTVIGVSP